MMFAPAVSPVIAPARARALPIASVFIIARSRSRNAHNHWAAHQCGSGKGKSQMEDLGHHFFRLFLLLSCSLFWQFILFLIKVL
jgi:hypothetical protein